MLYAADDHQMQSKVAIDSDEPSLGRIRADYIAPPHSLTSFKLCLSRVEKNPALAYAANIFEDTSSVTPLEEGQISFLCTDSLGESGLSPDEPMAIVLSPPIPGPPDGKYLIKNRAADDYSNYWAAGHDPITTVFFCPCTMEYAKMYNSYHVNEYSPIIQVFRG
jgi:hypothetical protein